MRPRPMTAENPRDLRHLRARDPRFNEAAADDRGKPRPNMFGGHPYVVLQ